MCYQQACDRSSVTAYRCHLSLDRTIAFFSLQGSLGKDALAQHVSVADTEALSNQDLIKHVVLP